MKKSAVIFILTFLLFFLFGCAEKTPPTINTETEAEYTAVVGELIIKGRINASLTDGTYISVSTPDELCGLSYLFYDTVTINYRGLNAVAEKDYLGDSNFAQSILNVIEDIPEGAQWIKEENQEHYFEGYCKSGKYILITDKSGNLRNIYLSKTGYDITFGE